MKDEKVLKIIVYQKHGSPEDKQVRIMADRSTMVSIGDNLGPVLGLAADMLKLPMEKVQRDPIETSFEISVEVIKNADDLGEFLKEMMGDIIQEDIRRL